MWFSSVATPPPTYTAAQIESIQPYLPDVLVVRDRLTELKNLIKTGDWVFVGNFIHGPMTEARFNLTYITPYLLPKDQVVARQTTKDLLNHLVKLDRAATEANTEQALTNYQSAVADIDKFLQLIPKSPAPSAPVES